MSFRQCVSVPRRTPKCLARTLTCLAAAALTLSVAGCTKVNPAPADSLSLSTGRPSLSAEVAEPPATSVEPAQGEALAPVGDSPLATPAPEESAPPAEVAAAQPTVPALPRQVTHKVNWGDTVLSIALQYGARMEEIVAANGLTNNVIYVGQELIIPLPEVPIGAQQYVVQPGDSLYGIAQLLGVEVDALMRANNLTNGYYLQVGQVLIVPAGGGPASTFPQQRPSRQHREPGPHPRRPARRLAVVARHALQRLRRGHRPGQQAGRP